MLTANAQSLGQANQTQPRGETQFPEGRGDTAQRGRDALASPHPQGEAGKWEGRPARRGLQRWSHDADHRPGPPACHVCLTRRWTSVTQGPPPASLSAPSSTRRNPQRTQTNRPSVKHLINSPSVGRAQRGRGRQLLAEKQVYRGLPFTELCSQTVRDTGHPGLSTDPRQGVKQSHKCGRSLRRPVHCSKRCFVQTQAGQALPFGLNTRSSVFPIRLLSPRRARP